MRKMIEYNVISAEKLPDLIDQVNALLALNWEPIGGPMYEPGGWNGPYTQAVVLYDKKVAKKSVSKKAIHGLREVA